MNDEPEFDDAARRQTLGAQTLDAKILDARITAIVQRPTKKPATTRADGSLGRRRSDRLPGAMDRRANEPRRSR